LRDYEHKYVERHKAKATASFKVLKMSLAMIHTSEASCAKPSAEMNLLRGLGSQASASQIGIVQNIKAQLGAKTQTENTM
jgi:hypothetical protein